MVNDAVGAVKSNVMVVLAFVALVGPVEDVPFVAPSCANRGRSVPWPQPVTTTVREEDDASELGENVQPVAEPALEKSAAVTPVTASENDKEYVTDESLVGEDCDDVKAVTEGIVCVHPLLLTRFDKDVYVSEISVVETARS